MIQIQIKMGFIKQLYFGVWTVNDVTEKTLSYLDPLEAGRKPGFFPQSFFTVTSLMVDSVLQEKYFVHSYVHCCNYFIQENSLLAKEA